MNSVERVKALCKERKIPISRLERDLGFANGYISQLRKGVFPSDRLAKIADYLSVSTDDILGIGSVVFYDVYADLCSNAGKKPSVVAAELGINKSNVSNWKNNGYTPRGDALQKIAKYFNVSTDYLLTGEQKEKAPIPTNYPDEEEPKSSSSNQAGPETVFYDEYIKLCNSISKSPTAVAKEMGFAGAHVTKWKNGSIPTDATIFKICDYFNLPHDYFSAEGDEETKIAVIQSDNEPIYLENTYLRLAQGAKELGLNDKDVSAILDFFRKLKL